ncbi:hypothetical protein RHGRI_012167 [Rhododendron griersonianum]|uniref:Protein kinase domain-containing protein n=1 Tax=Rhododendron griersonianum TaxID=479676 RepID=A0AAV6KQJ2_9ERIC|nr:hypothetical protein RHGRI_012167 [Rhododendron griersonianum]
MFLFLVLYVKNNCALIITFGSEATKLGSRREHFTKPIEFTSEQMCTFTDMFDKRNLIGPTQFGEVYRGKICECVSGSKTKNVIVKIWDEKSDPLVGKDEYLMEEVMFLTDASVVDHPNLVNVIGYCCRGVVHDLDPVDTLHNMMLKDDFTWLWRIKVALGFARLLEFLHGHDKPSLVFNIDACHIMLDQVYFAVTLFSESFAELLDRSHNHLCAVVCYKAQLGINTPLKSYNAKLHGAVRLGPRRNARARGILLGLAGKLQRRIHERM